jgi:hypothetical protein
VDRERTQKVLGVAAIAIAGIICATIASTHHLDGSMVTAIGTTAVVSGGLSAWFIDDGLATVLALPAIGIAGTVCELIAASAHNVQGGTVTGIGTAACIVIWILGMVLGD